MKKNYFVLGFLICLNFGYSQNTLTYNYGVWSPNAPTSATYEDDVIIQNGIYIPSGNVEVNDLTINSGAGIVVQHKFVVESNLTVDTGASMIIDATGSVIVEGDLITADNVILKSTSIRYSSLIVNGTIDGNAKYQRHVNIRGEGGRANNNDLISAPVTGEIFVDFAAANSNIVENSTQTRLFFGPFDKLTATFLTWNVDESSQLTPGIGYRAASKATGDHLFTFTGAINTGTIEVDIKNSGPSYKEWNLIGNPYPSYIDLYQFLRKNRNQLDPESVGVYGHNGKSPNDGDPWTTWNFAALDVAVSLEIAPGQGFFVASHTDPDKKVTFTEKMRVIGDSDDFIPNRNATPKNVAFFKVNIASGQKTYHSELYFNEHSTKGLDPGYDASVYGKKAPEFSIYSHLIEDNKGTDMAIQSLSYAELSGEVSIPLGINANEGQQIIVSITDSTLPAGTEVYLEDNINNTYTLLNTSDYTFTSTSILTGTGRFFLHTSNRALSTPSNELNGLQIYTTQANKTLYIKGLIKDNAQLNIYDVQGRLINTSQFKANTNSNQVDMSNLSTGIYVVELKSSALIRTQKVVLK